MICILPHDVVGHPYDAGVPAQPQHRAPDFRS